MTKFSLASLSLMAICFTVKAAEPLDPREFFRAIQGTYEIALINNEPVHQGATAAHVIISGDTGIIHTPYCTPNFCEEGNNYFQFSLTKVTREDLGAGNVTYTLI